MAELAEAALAEATLEDLLFLDQAERPAAFQPCLLNFTALGIEIQHNDQQQWFVPWEAMPEIMDSDASLRPCSVPESHPHVKQLHARFSFGFSNCAGCQFHLACRSEDQAECISRIVQLRSSQAVAMEGLPGLETDHVETREAQSYLEDTDVTSSPAGIFHTAPATLPFSSTPRPPICVEEAQPSREIVQHNLQLPEELLSALLDEPKVPEPLVLQHVWLHLPPVCPHYHRCLLQVDKLGLSLRPLGRSRKAAELHPISGLKVLQTESLSFPLSSILDVEEVFELLPPMGPMGVSVEPRTWKQQFGRKHYIPLARFIFSRPWKASEKQKPCPEYAERLPAAAAYFAVVKVRAGVTGKMPGQERRPAWRMRDPRPPVQLALAFYQKEEVTKLIATVLSFKSYQASTALQSILFKTRAIHARSKIPCEAEESPQDAPSEARLSASQPRIISNDDGEVFWYVPKKQGHLRENGSDTAGSSKVRPKPDFSDDRATISI